MLRHNLKNSGHDKAKKIVDPIYVVVLVAPRILYLSMNLLSKHNLNFSGHQGFVDPPIPRVHSSEAGEIPQFVSGFQKRSTKRRIRMTLITLKRETERKPTVQNGPNEATRSAGLTLKERSPV